MGRLDLSVLISQNSWEKKALELPHPLTYNLISGTRWGLAGGRFTRQSCVSAAAILHFSGGQLMVTGPVATAGIFATYLPDHMTLWRGFLNEVSGPG